VHYIALQMLIGDKAKYAGIIFGIAFATLLMTQQLAIFIGLMTRTYGFVTDTPQAEIWVMDPKVQFIDDLKPMQDTMLYRVRGVEGVEWAVPLYKGLLRARLENGNFQTCNVIGVDDATLIGGPPKMLEGRLEDLRRADSVIVDEVGAKGKLAKAAPIDPVTGKPTGAPTPLKIGDFIELNDHRAVVVGVCEVSRTFQSNPVVYTTYNRATTFAPAERRLMTFVMVKAKPGVDPHALCADIERVTGLSAYTSWDFSKLTYTYFMKYTGIPINFGIAVVLGFLVGTAIAGQTFYNFTLDNLKQFGALKAMGTSNFRLLRMIVLQAVVSGVIGYGIGLGLGASVGFLAGKSELAFRLIWQIPVATACAVTVICIVASLLSILKVIRLEPAIVFKG
jgi:putative ABC transport system permease protein